MRHWFPRQAFEIPGARALIAFRHSLVHGYDQVADDLTWGVIQTRVRPALEAAERMLGAKSTFIGRTSAELTNLVRNRETAAFLFQVQHLKIKGPVVVRWRTIGENIGVIRGDSISKAAH